MSLPNSLFKATREEAVAYASSGRGEISELFEFGGITDLDLSNLFSIITGEEFDFDQHELLPLEEGTEVDLIELPARFVSALACIEKNNIPKISIQWSETEELACDPKDLEPIVESLISLSKVAGDQSVYFTQ